MRGVMPSDFGGSAQSGASANLGDDRDERADAL